MKTYKRIFNESTISIEEITVIGNGKYYFTSNEKYWMPYRTRQVNTDFMVEILHKVSDTTFKCKFPYPDADMYKDKLVKCFKQLNLLCKKGNFKIIDKQINEYDWHTYIIKKL